MNIPLVWVCAATLCGLVLTQQASGRTTNGAATEPSSQSIELNVPPPARDRNHSATSGQPVHGNLHRLKGAVVSEMRATKAFVKETVVKDPTADKGLMLVAAFGMIFLQLRRKHKSLPQRHIVPYA